MKKHSRQFLIPIVIFFSSAVVYPVSGSTYTTVKDGHWTTSSTWAGGAAPNQDIDRDSVTINHRVEYGGDSLQIKNGTLTVSGILIIDNRNIELNHNNAALILTGGLVIIDNGNLTNKKGQVSLSNGGIQLCRGNYVDKSKKSHHGSVGSGYISADIGNIENKESAPFSRSIAWAVRDGWGIGLPSPEAAEGTLPTNCKGENESQDQQIGAESDGCSSSTVASELLYTYIIGNDSNQLITVDLFDELPLAIQWDTTFEPVVEMVVDDNGNNGHSNSGGFDASNPGKSKKIDFRKLPMESAQVVFGDSDRDVLISGITLPPGAFNVTLKTLPTESKGKIRNEAAITVKKPDLGQFTAQAAISIVQGADPPGPPVGDPSDPGLDGGHMDVDTSSFIAGIGKGSTDAHSHAYDEKYDVSEVDYFDLEDTKLQEITEVIPAGQKFKLIVANADLSVGAMMVINGDYDPCAPSTYIKATTWDDTEIADLPIFSLAGGNGSTKLEKLSVLFSETAIDQGGLIPTNTGDVKKNIPGPNGEWRNGAFTIQAIAVNSDDTDASTADAGMSAGGVQGVATSGLLWESTIFYHWDGPSYHESGHNFVPGSPPVEP